METRGAGGHREGASVAACDSNPGRGGVGEAAGYRQPIEAAPTKRGRSDRVPGGRVAGGSGLLLGRASPPPLPPGEVLAGAVRILNGQTSTTTPLGGDKGRTYVGAGAPTWGGAIRYTATLCGYRSPLSLRKTLIGALRSHGCDTSWFFFMATPRQ